MSIIPSTNHLVHFQFGVNDLLRAKQFYSRIFSWEFTESENMPDYLYFTIDEESSLTGGIQLVDGPVSTGNVRFYINVSDIPSILEKVVNNGGKIILEKTKLPDEDGYISRFEDPFGNVMGLWSRN